MTKQQLKKAILPITKEPIDEMQSLKLTLIWAIRKIINFFFSTPENKYDLQLRLTEIIGGIIIIVSLIFMIILRISS